jgi:hypothetical protein
MRTIAVGLILVTLMLLVTGAMAQTYYCSQSNQNGVWGGTLYMGDDGSIGIAVVAVAGGTYDSGPITSTMGDPASKSPILQQQYTINAENGQGFAMCALDDAQGNHADTYVNVANGNVDTTQEVGTVEKSCSSGVYSSQVLDESEADLIQAEADAQAANGDWAEVETYVSGVIHCLDQDAMTTTRTGGIAADSLGGRSHHSVSETEAWQRGSIGSRCNSDTSGIIEATSLDADGNFAIVSANVTDGKMKFFQEAEVETGHCGDELENFQWVDLKGKSGEVVGYSANATEGIHSLVMANFSNCHGTGSFEAITWAGVDNGWDTDTEAGLKIDPSCCGKLHNFDVYAEAQSGEGVIKSDSLDYFCCRKDYLAIAKSDDDSAWAIVHKTHF